MKKYFTFLCAFLVLFTLNAKQTRFDRFDISNGLSQNNINCLEIDDLGNIWLGTLDGVNRYNGYEFEKFKNSRNPLKGNQVVALGKGFNGDMWVVTRGVGLSYYSAASNQFQKIESKSFGQFAIDQSNKIIQSSDSLVWLSNFAILSVWNRVSDQFLSYQAESAIRGMELIDEKSVLIYGFFGIEKLSFILEGDKYAVEAVKLTTLPCFEYYQKGNEKYALQNNELVTLNDDFSVEKVLVNFSNYNLPYFNIAQVNDIVVSGNAYWIGGADFFLQVENENDSISIHNFEHNPQNDFSFKGNTVTYLVDDDLGNIWIGTLKNGLNHFNRLKNQFQHYSWDYGKITDPGSDPVRAICKSGDNDLWLGFDRGGVGVITDKGGLKYYTHYFTVDNEKRIIENVRILFEDSKGTIWIGESNNLCYFNKVKKRIETVECLYGWKWPYRCYVIKEFEPGFVYITSALNVGIVNLKDGSISTIPLTNDNIQNIGTVRDIIQDRYRNLWVIKDGNGIMKIEYPDLKYESILAETHLLSDNKVYCMLINGDSLWIGTNVGLNLFDIKANKVIKKYDETNGLCNNIIYSLYSDYNGDLWMSTNKGISHFDIQNSTFRTFLPNDFFMDDAHFIDKQGQIFYGGYTGVIAFQPSDIEVKKISIRSVVDKLFVYNKQVYPGDSLDGKVVYNKALTDVEHLELNYTQNSFSLGFNAFPFDYPNSTLFRYRLNGLHNEWIEAQGNRIAAYTKVPAGSYEFELQVATLEKVFGESHKLKIEIIPPFWKTAWFKFLTILFVLLIVLGFYRLRIRQIKQGNVLLKKKVDEQTAELREQNKTILKMSDKLHEADQSKLRFFTNISHEFRTPLTLILGQIEQLDTESKSAVKSIRNNALRLLRLINQLIDLRKLDQDQLKLSITEFDFVLFISEIVNSFKTIADQKDINLVFTSDFDQLKVWLDFDKMEKIVYNLLSNALKYTENGKVIKVNINAGENHFNFRVSDEGIGMSKDELNHAFDRFYRSESGQKISKGHGIGLSLVKGLTEIQHGTINVKSEAGVGSRFDLSFLLGKSHFDEIDITNDALAFVVPDDTDENITSLEFERLGNKKLLIVEDNLELANFLADMLKNLFTLKIAGNGKEAFDLVAPFQPDIIISDVMMPVMDGIAFCKKLKTNIETSHIPIILLTAKTDIETQLEGFENGADDYIGKPFHQKILLARIKALLINRENVKTLFSKSAQQIPVMSSLNQREIDFIEKVNRNIDQLYIDPLFNIDVLSGKLNMSRATFYRKFSDLTGTKPADYIRKIRLRNAFESLQKTNDTIIQVSERVGFQSVSHFRKTFKEEFGKTPSEVQKGK